MKKTAADYKKYIRKGEHGWYFYDETWTELIGPYETAGEAIQAFDMYFHYINRPIDLNSRSVKAKKAMALKRFEEAATMFSNRGMYTGDPDYPDALEDIGKEYKDARENLERLINIR